MSVQSMPAKTARNLRRLLAVCGLAVLGLPAASNAAVMQTTLDRLLPGGNESGGIVIGDKRYSNFSYSSTGSAPVRAQDVNVRINNDANPQQYTLEFTFGMDAFPGERTDLVIGYDLDVLSRDFINRAGLRFNGSVPSQGVGDAAASVVETVSSRDGSDVAVGAPIRDTEVLDVFNDGPGRLEDSNSDFLALNLTRSLHFVKDIIVSSRPTGGYAAISVVTNTVDQVPEPAVISLIGFAGGALLLRRRRA
jgi:hypothetical protein